MTTFGGQTVPPLFVGAGGGFAQGDIRIHAVSSLTVISGGNPQAAIASSSADIDDEIWVAELGSSFNAPTEVSGNWTEQLSFSPSFRFWHRIADGTSADDWIMPVNAGFVIAIMWTLKEFTTRVFPSAAIQGGFLRDGFIAPWPVGFPPGVSLPLNTAQDPFKYVTMWAMRRESFFPATPTPSVSNSPVTDMETIFSGGIFRGQGAAVFDTLWMVIQFRYTAVSIAYDAYNIGYSPNSQTLDMESQHRRFVLSL